MDIGMSRVNPGLPGFLSFWVSPRALCWVLFSSSYILLTFPLSFQNIRLLVISLLMTFRHNVHGPPSSQLLLARKISLLSNHLNSWMSSNSVSLNSAKTQLIWFGTPQQLLKLDHAFCFLTVFPTLPFILLFVTWVSLW